MEARKLAKEWLENNGVQYSKITTKTVGFSDLARASKVFVTVRLFSFIEPDKYANARKFATDNGFIFNFSAPGAIG